MESSLCISWQIICFLKKGKLLRFKCIASRAKKIQCLTILEENRFLALMNNQLRTIIEILNGVFPDKSAVIAFLLDDACQPVFPDLLRNKPLLDIILIVTNRAHKS